MPTTRPTRDGEDCDFLRPDYGLTAGSAENEETPRSNGDAAEQGGLEVELRGVEPLASSMRPRRSSQLSYSPEGRVILAVPAFEPCSSCRAAQRSPTACIWTGLLVRPALR
jgi:hypothetical protein